MATSGKITPASKGVLDAKRALKSGLKDEAIGLKKMEAEQKYLSARIRAKDRGAVLVRKVLKQDDMLTVEKIYALWGDAVWASIENKIYSHDVICLTHPDGYRVFPFWQFEKNGDVKRGISRLFKELYDDPWSVYRFLVTPCADLEGAMPKEKMWEDPEGLRRVIEIAHSIGRL